jgi:hypothetical protein
MSLKNKVSKLITVMQKNPIGFTENGAFTNATTSDAVTDLFFVAGATRSRTEGQILDQVKAAWAANPELTTKLLFWARDVLQGAGERRFFRIALKGLAQEHAEKLAPVVRLVPEFGRWDDLLTLFGTPLEGPALAAIRDGLEARNGLAGKWLPRQGPEAVKIRKALGLKEPKAFRRLLVDLSKTVEQQMSAKKWDEVNYSHVPSIAAKKYRKAFLKHDEARYKEYILDIATRPDSGAKINAKAIFPHDVVKAALQDKNSADEIKLLDAQWKALPDFLAGKNGQGRRILPVVDVSGSMYMALSPRPIEVSVSLGIYVAERNTGPFKDHFVTFSSTPELVKLKGANIREKVEMLSKADWGMSTDLNKVFKLILRQATTHDVPAEEMPEIVLVMSDMEFNAAGGGKTPFEEIQADYKQAGYAMPKVVFWNLAARSKAGNYPVIQTEPHTALISGFSPSILKPVLAGEIPSPYGVMLEVLNAERYSQVKLA